MVARFSETLPTTDHTPVLAHFPDFSPRIKSRYLHIFLICNLFIPPLMCPKKLKWHSFMGKKCNPSFKNAIFSFLHYLKN